MHSLLHVTRAAHLWIGVSFVSQAFCGKTAPWMVSDQLSRNIVDIDTFFQNQNSPILFGTDKPSLPRHLVTVAQRHACHLEYPSLTPDVRSMPGLPGPPSHQHRFRHILKHDYTRLCQLEEAIASGIDPGKKKCMIILPSRFVLPDSVPSRTVQNVVTLSMGHDMSGRFVLIPEYDAACSSS